MDTELALVVEFLRVNGYRVTGVTFDLVQPSEGWTGVGLLPNDQEVRFFYPTKEGITPAIQTPVHPTLRKVP